MGFALGKINSAITFPNNVALSIRMNDILVTLTAHRGILFAGFRAQAAAAFILLSIATFSGERRRENDGTCAGAIKAQLTLFFLVSFSLPFFPSLPYLAC